MYVFSNASCYIDMLMFGWPHAPGEIADRKDEYPSVLSMSWDKFGHVAGTVCGHAVYATANEKITFNRRSHLQPPKRDQAPLTADSSFDCVFRANISGWKSPPPSRRSSRNARRERKRHRRLLDRAVNTRRCPDSRYNKFTSKAGYTIYKWNVIASSMRVVGDAKIWYAFDGRWGLEGFPGRTGAVYSGRWAHAGPGAPIGIGRRLSAHVDEYEKRAGGFGEVVFGRQLERFLETRQIKDCRDVVCVQSVFVRLQFKEMEFYLQYV